MLSRPSAGGINIVALTGQIWSANIMVSAFVIIVNN